MRSYITIYLSTRLATFSPCMDGSPVAVPNNIRSCITAVDERLRKDKPY